MCLKLQIFAAIEGFIKPLYNALVDNPLIDRDFRVRNALKYKSYRVGAPAFTR